MAATKKKKKKKDDKPKDGKKNGRTKTVKDTKNLRCILSADEVAERADRMSHLLAEHDQKDAAQKAQAKHAKSQIEEIAAKIRHLGDEVRDKATYREVEIERTFDYEDKEVTERRLDTKDVIDRRPMTPEELQMGLFGGDDDPKKPDEKKGDDLDSDFKGEGDNSTDKAAE